MSRRPLRTSSPLDGPGAGTLSMTSQQALESREPATCQGDWHSSTSTNQAKEETLRKARTLPIKRRSLNGKATEWTFFGLRKVTLTVVYLIPECLASDWPSDYKDTTLSPSYHQDDITVAPTILRPSCTPVGSHFLKNLLSSLPFFYVC